MLNAHLSPDSWLPDSLDDLLGPPLEDSPADLLALAWHPENDGASWVRLRRVITLAVACRRTGFALPLEAWTRALYGCLPSSALTLDPLGSLLACLDAYPAPQP